MFNLLSASTELKKVAYTYGIKAGHKNARFKPYGDDVIIKDDDHVAITITRDEIVEMGRMTWMEIKSCR